MTKRPLSIVLFGNTNNYPLLLAEGFRALGHHVHLYVNRKETLHRPESKYPGLAGKYPPWIIDCSMLTDEDFACETPALDSVIGQFVNNSDLVILNDIGPALGIYLRCPYVVLLTGSDLTYYGNYETINPRSASWDPEFKRSFAGRRGIRRFAGLITSQRDGILGAEVVSFGLRGLIPAGDRLLDSIGVTDNRRMMIYLSDTMSLKKADAPKNKALRVFNGCRVLWRQAKDQRYSPQDLKATDVLLKGFSLYCAHGGSGELRMPRKGQDLEVAIALADELGISRRIAWLAEMSMEVFRNEVASADIICDQFGQSFPGMVTTDAYAMGRPVLANFRNEIFATHFGTGLPGLQASSPEEVCERLLWADGHRDELALLGAACRQYAETHLSPGKMANQLLKRCVESYE